MDCSECALINTSLQRGATSMTTREPLQRFLNRVSKPLKRLSGVHLVLPTPQKQGVNESFVGMQRSGG